MDCLITFSGCTPAIVLLPTALITVRARLIAPI